MRIVFSEIEGILFWITVSVYVVGLMAVACLIYYLIKYFLKGEEE